MLVAIFVSITSLMIIGFSECAMVPKIVGGNAINITNYAYSAFLSIQCEMKQTLDLFGWICGSSILNQKILLTAAHCLAECTPNSWVSVSVGHVHMKKGWRSSGSGYVVHEYYHPDTTINDIGLVKLRTALNFSASISRVILVNNPPKDEMALVAGWGIIDEQSKIFGAHLKVINQRIWNTTDCIELFKNIPRGTFCAGSDNGEGYAAGGDSGSALIVRGNYQIGLVSYKKPETSRYVVIYTDTRYFYHWIVDNARRLHCDNNARN